MLRHRPPTGAFGPDTVGYGHKVFNHGGKAAFDESPATLPARTTTR